MADHRSAGSNAGCHCEAGRQLRSPAVRTTGEMDRRPLLRFPDSGHYDAASDAGAENWACLASLIETCKLNGVDPQAYLTDVLTRLVNLWPAARIDELMPWAWTGARWRRPAGRVTDALTYSVAAPSFVHPDEWILLIFGGRQPPLHENSPELRAVKTIFNRYNEVSEILANRP